MIIKLYRIIKNCYLNKQDKKKQKILKQLFPTSQVSSTAVYDLNTILCGENVVFENTNIQSSIVGKCSYVGRNSNLSNCVIGAFCSIASNVHIQPATHPIMFVSTYPGFFNTINNLPFGKGIKDFEEMITCKDGHFVIIGNDVWIGENVTIKGGVKIGDGAIIGMNSLVTKDVPPYAIVGGNPARIIRYRFDKVTVNHLLEIKWWDWPLTKIKGRRNDFVDVNSFIEGNN